METASHYYCPREDIVLTEQEVIYIWWLPLQGKTVCRRCGGEVTAIAEDDGNETRSTRIPDTRTKLIFFVVTFVVLRDHNHGSSSPG